MAWAWVLWHKNIGKWEVGGHLLRTHVEFMTRQWFFSSAPYLGRLKSCSALTSLGTVNDKAPMKPAEQGVCALGMAGRGWLLHHKELKFCAVQCGHAWPQPASCLVRECTVLSPDCSLALAGGEGCRKVLWTEFSCPLKFRCWNPSAQRDGMWRWGLWEMIRFRGGCESEPLTMRFMPLWDKTWACFLFLLFTMWGETRRCHL